MHCIHLALAFLSLSFCHQEATPVRLPGVWVGMLEAGGDLQFIRAEFVRGRSRATGTLHLAGTGDLTLVKASESDGYICFVMRRGDDEFVFAGILDSVRAPDGQNVRVDNEGAVKEGDSQTTRTVQRAAIGTAVGAIIGAIAGGGKGAAIGAVIGAGAGAGSVYVQGRNDLELNTGTEVTIRATGPRN